MGASSNATYLGLDLSTQQLKAVVVDDDLGILHETSVQFDNDLPEFRTYGGVIQNKCESHVVVAPTLMWVKALDMILDKLRVCGVDFSKVSAISGCAQRISLISSFLASLFLGDFAPIDWSDGSGMNLLNIRTKDWDDVLLETCAPDLRKKLGKPISSYNNIGPISSYFVERFGFNESCRIIAFTGDNPGSLVGMRLKKGDIACSLGTSDTLFLWLNEPKTAINGHILCNPIEDEAYMALLCFKNGSLTRERIRDNAAQGSWQIFNELLESTPRGNFGNFGLYFDAQEILPSVIGDHRFNKANDEINRYSSKEVEVRALIEGQFVAKRAHAEDFGFVIGPNTRIIATGGASANKTILQVLADVFNSPVYISLFKVPGVSCNPNVAQVEIILKCAQSREITNSAMMGAAYQAKHGLLRNKNSFEDITASLPEPTLVCRPYDDAESIYRPMTQRYRKLIERVIKRNQSQSDK
ncbi:xylulose kinase isoform X4 [Vespa velutina]|uniref:xylulose kinase isoform X4 n=1 Tax=Vespa velutina TaxID=202808 RepID=UPI001FB50C49|nr:xylulose kinase isoform X4 [Vespa velutina]